jgi:hypothetical protein
MVMNSCLLIATRCRAQLEKKKTWLFLSGIQGRAQPIGLDVRSSRHFTSSDRSEKSAEGVQCLD